MLPFGLSRPRGRALRVLCLGAHSDDIEIGCGGTVLQLVRGGAEVHWAVFSGEAARAEEARRSARRFLGPSGTGRLTLREFRDGFFPAQFAEIKEAVEEVRDQVRPDLVFTHFRHDRHQDHRTVSDLSWNTFRTQVVLEYEVPKWDGDMGQPGAFVPLSPAVARRKVRYLMEVFATQRTRDWFDEALFFGLLRLRGMECRAPGGLAEAFYSRKVVLDFTER
jgi:LmbE family N-acetylglucosaminyl deacetylase